MSLILDALVPFAGVTMDITKLDVMAASLSLISLAETFGLEVDIFAVDAHDCSG